MTDSAQRFSIFDRMGEYMSIDRSCLLVGALTMKYEISPKAIVTTSLVGNGGTQSRC